MLQHDHDEITQNFQVVTLVFFFIYPEKLLLGPARRSSRSKRLIDPSSAKEADVFFVAIFEIFGT